METKEKDKLKEKREFYQYLKELGLEPKLDRELQAEKEEKTAKENMQKILNKHNDSKRIKKIGGNSEQKVLKAEKTNKDIKKEEFDRKKIIINHLKETFK